MDQIIYIYASDTFSVYPDRCFSQWIFSFRFVSFGGSVRCVRKLEFCLLALTIRESIYIYVTGRRTKQMIVCQALFFFFVLVLLFLFAGIQNKVIVYIHVCHMMWALNTLGTIENNSFVKRGCKFGHWYCYRSDWSFDFCFIRLTASLSLPQAI